MNKKILILITAMVLALSMVTGATIAYLSTITGEVKNTFVSGGFGKIYLQEVDGGSNPTSGWLSGTNNNHVNSYTIIPGVDINKDPKVKFEFDSDSAVTNAYVYVKIVYTHSTTNGWTFDKTNRKLLGYVNGKQAFVITLNSGWYIMNATTDGSLILSIGTSANAVTSVQKGGTHAILSGASVFKNIGTTSKPATIDVSTALVGADIETFSQNQASYNLAFSAYAIQKDGLEAGPAWTAVKDMQ
jgi:hypothetical protein